MTTLTIFDRSSTTPSEHAEAIEWALGRAAYQEARLHATAIVSMADRLCLSEVKLIATTIMQLLGEPGNNLSSEQVVALRHLAHAVRAADGS
jgi:hypothetical protein